MNSILTGQIDLNLLQKKLGIGLQQLNDFLANQGVEAIKHFITLNIVNTSIYLTIFVIMLIIFIFKKNQLK